MPVRTNWVDGDLVDASDLNTIGTAINANTSAVTILESQDVFGEVPSGVQNGTNVTLTLFHTFQAGSTAVYRNGLREQLGVGYTESTPNIIFSTAPLSSDVITVDYLIA